MIRSFKQFLRESIVDPLHSSVSPQIFQNPYSDNPQLKEGVQRLIENDLNRLSAVIKIKDVVLVGSILTKRYREDTDLDVHILAEGTAKDDDRLANLAEENSGKLVPGTLHPINYYIITNQKDHERANSLADGVFDIHSNSFIRKPTDRPFDISQYFGEFKKKIEKIDLVTTDLKHDLIDYQQLKNVPKDEIEKLSKMIEDHLKEIEKDAIELVDIYNEIKQARKDAFAGEVTPEEIRKYGEKNRTPGNVIFKLMEKYHYLEFLKRVKDIIGDDMKVTDDEAEKLNQLLNKGS